MSDGDLNPFYDPGPWGLVQIAGEEVRCTLIEVDGFANPEDWSVTKGTGSSGATAAWKGMKLIEGGKLKFRANDGPSFQANTDLLARLRPKRGKKPPSVNIVNAIVNWGGFTQGALKMPPQPKYIASTNAWDFEYEFQEYDPSVKADTGAAKAPDPDGKDPPDKQSEADKEIDKLQDKLNKL